MNHQNETSPPPSVASSTSTASYGHQRRTRFQPRTSRLDSDTLKQELPEFRGFFILFWLMLFISMLTQFVHNWRTEGRPFRTKLLEIFLRDLLVFSLSDFAMVLLTGLAFVVHWMIVHRWVHPYVGWALKHFVQMGLMLAAIQWTFWRNWPWPQSAVLILHGLSMYMKMHSYMSTNWELEWQYRRAVQLQNELFGFSELAGELDPQLQNTTGSETTAALSTAVGSPMTRRRRSVAQLRPATPTSSKNFDQRVSELTELEKELRRGDVQYPRTVTIGNFVDYMLCPTLVYELEYPRVKTRFRWSYFLEKCAATLGIALVMYFIIEHQIHPTLDELRNITLLECILRLLVPFTILWILLFYLIFEGVCNAAAEFTGFADRSFYDDWWNSCSFDEFARKWNKPVHEFLLRHIYLEAIDKHKMSKVNATFLTFLFSSILHELVIAIIAKKIIFLFFFLQMMQVPLIWLGRVTYIRKMPLLGNLVFWISLMHGFPLICIFYTWEVYLGADQKSWLW